MLAVLGEITFEVITGPSRLDITQTWQYAEHAVVEDVPRLQWTGDALKTLEFEAFCHFSFTDPATQWQALVNAGEDHQARPLVFGNGEHLGYFVVTSIHTIHKQMSSAGDWLSLSAVVTLKEYPLLAEAASGSGIPLSFNPIALADTITSTANTSGSSSVSSSSADSGSAYSPIPLNQPGVSPLLTVASSSATSVSAALPDDVPPSAIVRASL